MMKPSELWALCNNSCYEAIKHVLSAVQRNAVGASGGERNIISQQSMCTVVYTFGWAKPRLR
jgi:hypothetical protein